MKAYEKHSYQAGNRGQTNHPLDGILIYMYLMHFRQFGFMEYII